MRTEPDFIEKILPFGELLRGFSNQSYLTKAELNKFLKSRGIFHRFRDKEHLVPTVATLLLSPDEFDLLRDFQNTREDNQKKSTSRIEWQPDTNLGNSLRNISFEGLIPDDGVNFKLTSPPNVEITNKVKEKIIIEFEVERNDLNKSWYQSNNIFTGKIEIETTDQGQLRITKSYTSSESNFVAERIQKVVVNHLKTKNHILSDNELEKILFGDFNNTERIVFFYRLSSNMNSSNFEFKDIVNVEFTPEDSVSLPIDIEWMVNKTELKLKGKSIHNTFFIKDKKYHPFLRVWEMESSFKFDYSGFKGSCNVVFAFKDYPSKGEAAEFTINISNFSIIDSSEYSSKDRNRVKRNLLDVFDKKKDETYVNFINYLKEKRANIID